MTASEHFDRRGSVPISLPRRFSRETALAKPRGRAYSTFTVMSDEDLNVVATA